MIEEECKKRTDKKASEDLQRVKENMTCGICFENLPIESTMTKVKRGTPFGKYPDPMF